MDEGTQLDDLENLMDEDAWYVARSRLDRRVWVAMPVGFGDQSAWLCPGTLRAVKRYVAHGDDVRWERVSADLWKAVWPAESRP